MLSEKQCSDYITVLKEELIQAMGCTEPIAIAYAGAVARRALGKMPEKVRVEVSGNIIKNVKSVIVPNTGRKRGIAAAVGAGIVYGNPDLELKVISAATPEQIEELQTFLSNTPLEIRCIDKGHIFDINITLIHGNDTAFVRICDFHTNITEVRLNDTVLVTSAGAASSCTEATTDRSFMSVEDIIEFADTVDLERVKPVLDHQIQCNMAIAEEGLRGNYGANIGKVLLHTYGDSDVRIRARAKAAAGSDARMNGCELPVVINSGSGNQGITASVPVIEYANSLGVSDELRYRALLVSNLCTIHLKTGIGRLSAYCGAVSAGCGAGAGIAYLNGERLHTIAHTLVNALAIDSGIVCDGAKASCAAKISAAVDAGMMGYQMALEHQQFYGGDGLVQKGVENTIRNIGTLAREGMAETDRKILEIMINMC